MADGQKRVDVRLGAFACSIQGFDDPAAVLERVLERAEAVLSRSEAIARVAAVPDEAGRAALVREVAEAGGLDPAQVFAVPGLVVLRDPEAAGAEAPEPASATLPRTTADDPDDRVAAVPVEPIGSDHVEAARQEPAGAAEPDHVEASRPEDVRTAGLEPGEAAGHEPAEPTEPDHVEAAGVEPVEAFGPDHAETVEPERSEAAEPASATPWPDSAGAPADVATRDDAGRPEEPAAALPSAAATASIAGSGEPAEPSAPIAWTGAPEQDHAPPPPEALDQDGEGEAPAGPGEDEIAARSGADEIARSGAEEIARSGAEDIARHRAEEQPEDPSAPPVTPGPEAAAPRAPGAPGAPHWTEALSRRPAPPAGPPGAPAAAADEPAPAAGHASAPPPADAAEPAPPALPEPGEPEAPAGSVASGAGIDSGAGTADAIADAPDPDAAPAPDAAEDGDAARWTESPEPAAADGPGPSSPAPAGTAPPAGGGHVTQADPEQADRRPVNIFAPPPGREPDAVPPARHWSERVGRRDRPAPAADAAARTISAPAADAPVRTIPDETADEPARTAFAQPPDRLTHRPDDALRDGGDGAPRPRVNIFAPPPEGDARSPDARQRARVAEDGPDDGTLTLFRPAGRQSPPQAPEPISPQALSWKANARSTPEQLVCAAAWLTFVERRPRFTRREVLQILDRIPSEQTRNLEARVKGFGRLIRDGDIIQLDDTTYMLGEAALGTYARHFD